MSCEDLDRLRTGSPDLARWPPEARRHLDSCEPCSRLQATLDSPARTDFPEALRDRIEGAILRDLRPVSPLPGAMRVAVTLLLCSVGVIAAANWRLGMAGWRARDTLQASVDFGLLGVCVLVLAHLVARQMSPGSRRGAPVGTYLGVPILALLLADVCLFEFHWHAAFVPLAISCWTIGVTCAAISGPLFWLALRRGCSLDPVGHGAVAGLLAGLVGVTVLEIYCNYLDRLHISTSHLGAAVTAALAGAAIGSVKKRIARRAP